MVFNLQQDFEIGLDFHKKGNIVEAEQQYKKVLTKNSNHFDSLHLLGVINSQKGNTQEAIYLIKKSININNNIAKYAVNCFIYYYYIIIIFIN